MSPAKLDLYKSVTDHIISSIENLSEDDRAFFDTKSGSKTETYYYVAIA
ncbi:MAG: hypothetical protein L3J21_06030 [Devosiaceae bacterium]|nr:hypothetical protein [Devosiaceae bacterium]